MNFFDRKRPRVAMIMQDANGECGLASLAMVARWHGHRFDLRFLRDRYPVSARGLTFGRLAEIATELGLSARALGIDDLGDLAKVRLPALLHWENNHFVILCSVRRGRYVINNPAFGIRELSLADMQRQFSGSLMEFERRDDFARIVGEKKLTLRRLLDTTQGLKTSVMQVVCISVATAAISLVLPILVQAALDDVIPRRDSELLMGLTAAFVIASLFNALGDWYRDRILLNAGSSFVAQFTRNAVGHLFRLPLRYFESRHPADITVRLDSIEHIKAVIVNAFVTALVDIIVIILATVMMFAYAPLLGTIILSTLAVVAAIRVLAFPHISKHGGAALKARSVERARLVDNLRAVIPLRMGQALGRSSSVWYAALLNCLNAEFRLGRIETNIAFLVNAIIATGVGVTLYFGVAAVMANELTIGMLYAFFTFRSLFFERLESVVSSTIQVSMLSANMARLQDFTSEKVEDADTWRNAGGGQVAGTVHLESVDFRVGASDKPILSGIDFQFDVSARETIGIVGSSGAGKSTLLKILSGLYGPTSGTMLIEGRPLSKFGLERYRRSVGLLLGADKLFRGTILENVSGMDVAPDRKLAQSCLTIACLSDEVNALPWELDTIVSEESSLLSTGQRRRLMLARALYKRPPILLLDEIVSNLDAETASRIVDNLRAVPAAKIISSHSAAIIPGCDRYLRLEGGLLIEERDSTESEITSEGAYA